MLLLEVGDQLVESRQKGFHTVVAVVAHDLFPLVPPDDVEAVVAIH